MPQNAPRDRYGRFRRRHPSCWNDRRNAQKNLKTYSKSRAGGRPVVEIETRIYKKKPAAPIVHLAEKDANGNILEDERQEKRRKLTQGNDMVQIENHGRPDSNGLRVWNHPTRKGTQQIRRILPPQKTHAEEMRERSQSIGTALRKERGLIGQPSWKPRSGIVPSAHLLKMLKTRQNLQTDPQTYSRPRVGMDENKPQGHQNERISPRAQDDPNGGEAQPAMEDDPFGESTIGEEAAIHQRPVPTPSPSPPLFCSVPPVTPMPENHPAEPTIKISSWPPNSQDSNPHRTDRSTSTPPPIFRFLSPVPTTRDTPTPTPRPNLKRRRSIPFRRAFLVPSVEAREMSTINETPLLEPEPRKLDHRSSPDLDESHGPRQVQQEPLQETREVVDRSRYNLNESQGPRQTQQEPVPEGPELAHRSPRDSNQSQGSRQTQHDLVNDSGDVASRIVPPATNPTTETKKQQASQHSRKLISDSDLESKSEGTCTFPVVNLPQPHDSPSPTCSSPILPVDRARSRSIDSISEAGVLSESRAISESGALSDSEESDIHATPSTPELISDDSMSSPAHQNDAAVTPSPDDSFSADGYCLRVSKFDADGNKSTTRTINVPATYNFEQLHKGLLSAFCLPPNLRYNFGLLKLSEEDKELGHGYRRPYPRERLLLAGAWKKSFETNWRAGAIVIEQLMKEIEDDAMLDLWWSHERGVVWTHHIEFVGKRSGVGRPWCTGESGGGKIFFEKGS